ncbi:uncharacterized protein MELLADRAFT_71182 [Melampsora larici-populina 98AG31]|uniref:Uncharacterized protein n=1 Tax=Melampsora larici-populina (strain 98AG31 / pathotype 3-4-7) TaxID=747676 RepID=F4RD41_MELLP|nr:uncharacterized protein MELLADRAFT_71182 [Melampsora larici-populina 98AG31]EGG09879.1 hypothetical protein MELLADRAFT_71182 [Melampsora larici-populina 98AG31]
MYTTSPANPNRRWLLLLTKSPPLNRRSLESITMFWRHSSQSVSALLLAAGAIVLILILISASRACLFILRRVRSRRTKQIDAPTTMRSSGFSFDLIQRSLQHCAEKDKKDAAQKPETAHTSKEIPDFQLDDFSWNRRTRKDTNMLEAVIKEAYPCITVTDVQNQTTSVDTTLSIYSLHPIVILSDWSPPTSPTNPASQQETLRQYPDCGV